MREAPDITRAERTEEKELEEAVFAAALGLDGAAVREAFLDRWFTGDAAGLQKMRGLLAAAEEAGPFFLEAVESRVRLAREVVEEAGFPAAAEPADGNRALPEKPGECIGPYLLLERLGEGGCGVVYKAEQREPVRRLVALKVIRLGMDTEGVIRRFGLERQALAMMDHPHIARVLDAGATDAGRPYFVMELAGGQRITAFCDGEKLGVPERLALFVQVCHAVQHAHQKGIIHRDLKPSNILVERVDGTPLPKVIDFGIAKAAAGRATGRTTITGCDQMIGTPAYMSPEQVDLRGLDIDTRSDVYSLGMLLYELLAGRAPFDEAEAAGLSGMRRFILEHEPPAPSRALAEMGPEKRRAIAAGRRLDPERLASVVRGDLDAIVLKAVEKDRNRRYQTANSLAMDVQRFLRHEPVLARRPGRLYSMGKFIRRHLLACVAGAAVAVSVLGGLGASSWLFWRERKALAEQVRLAQAAEAARAQEDRLRAEAQVRTHLAQAAGWLTRAGAAKPFPTDHDLAGVAALIDAEKEDQVDALMRALPPDSIEPSPDAARVFRSLGHWNALRGRWAEALHCFTVLNRVNRFSPPAGIAEGTDLTCLAALLAEHGTAEDYQAFRSEILRRHLPARSALAAEHVLKSCLLLPVEGADLAQLRQAVEMCASGARSDYSGRDSFPQWDALAQAMFYHRLGDTGRVMEWSQKCLGFPGGRGDRECSARCLRAMALARLGETARMENHLSAARALMRRAPDPLLNPKDFRIDVWVDWAVSRLLLAETEALVASLK